MSSPRQVLIPVALFCGVSATAFTLAKLHPARPGIPKASAVALGDFYRGQTVFSQKCSACHGQDGNGGPVGPKLDGDALSLPKALAQIQAGRGAMPGGLVKGRDERDVLAFLATILAKD